MEVGAPTLLAGDIGCGGTDYSFELRPTLTALVFEYGHGSVSHVIMARLGYDYCPT
jgi:hypothetical protein